MYGDELAHVYPSKRNVGCVPDGIKLIIRTAKRTVTFNSGITYVADTQLGECQTTRKRILAIKVAAVTAARVATLG